MRSVYNGQPLICYGRQHRLAHTTPHSSVLSCALETGKLRTVFLGLLCSYSSTCDTAEHLCRHACADLEALSDSL